MNGERRIHPAIRAAACAFGIALAGWGGAALSQTVPDIPLLEGPITGPGSMYPGLRPLTPGTEPESYGYVTQEYFISGTAAGAPYKTRILVRRPQQAKRFSGAVVALCTLPVSDFPWGAGVAMGLHHLLRWIDRGKAPPHAPYIEVDNDLSDGSRLALDERGNAKGGVRNTYVDVPIAQYGVPNAGATPPANFLCSIAGWRISFPDELLATLYRNKKDYLSIAGSSG
jgi:hypothetical protein